MKARHKDTGEIIELAEEGIISCDGRRFCWYQVELIPEPIDECKPSLPSNLDEAAEISDLEAKNLADDYTKFLATGLTKNEPHPIGPQWMKKLALDRFKAGAEWMAWQGVTVDGIITKVGYKLDVETTEYILPEESEFERGDKVIVQIRKKQ